MSYGVPYKGSKNQIAKWVIGVLPAGKRLVDLFAGGCAVTHAALEQMSGLAPKWNSVLANDIDPMPVQLFCDAIAGKYTVETQQRWISREDFYRLRDTDPYVRYCWSFGCDGRSYMYGKGVEPWRHALHDAYVRGEYDLLEEICGYIPPESRERDRVRAWVRKNGVWIREKYAQWYANHKPEAVAAHVRGPELRFIEHLECLHRHTRLEMIHDIFAMKPALETSAHDYCAVELRPGDVVYCDIPYMNTSGYGIADKRFDYAAFFDWACDQRVQVYISSYQIDDPRFNCIAERQKLQLINDCGAGKHVTERIYTPKNA